MFELTDQDKAKLQYIKLYEEQILFNYNKQKSKTFIDKLIIWLQR